MSEGDGSARVEAFVSDLFAPEDEHLRRIRDAMEGSGLPGIQLPRSTARAIQLLVRLAGARRVLEVGTLAGYSALWIARALPADGRILSLERDPERVRLARDLLARAGVEERVEVREADAGEALGELDAGGWDVVFLDADKEGLPRYVRDARRLLRSGGLLLVDNALWRNQVPDPGVDDEATRAIRSALREVAADPSFDATVLPVGDGLLVGIRG